MDCFSRKANIYGTNTKNAEILLKYVTDFCLNNNIPNEFICDNGAEFKNRIFKNFCEIHNIKFLHGDPYSPHSQGIVERFNYTMKKYLCKEYFYNNKIHRILGMSPIEAYKITDITKIKEINEKKISYLQKLI